MDKFDQKKIKLIDELWVLLLIEEITTERS